MFGLGGVLVEILKDVSFRVLPISPPGAKKMIEEIKASVILNGYRDRPPMDKKALTKAAADLFRGDRDITRYQRDGLESGHRV
jgi:acyl-CoA synthetase (NDP forming)